MIPNEAHSWRPQSFSRRLTTATFDESLIEPLWDGTRILVYIDSGPSVRLVDEAGRDLTSEHEAIRLAVAAAARSEGLVLDGYLTSQATRTGAGLGDAGPEVPTLSQSMTRLFVGERRSSRLRQLPGMDEEASRQGPAHDRDELVAFVAVDVLFVDDQIMLGVPLLERKRILESVLAEADLVRHSPFVRPPIGPWLSSWRALGFRRIALKGANSRYAPGSTATDWATERIPER